MVGVSLPGLVIYTVRKSYCYNKWDYLHFAITTISVASRIVTTRLLYEGPDKGVYTAGAENIEPTDKSVTAISESSVTLGAVKLLPTVRLAGLTSPATVSCGEVKDDATDKLLGVTFTASTNAGLVKELFTVKALLSVLTGSCTVKVNDFMVPAGYVPAAM